MKLTLEPTEEVAMLSGVPCRAWRGTNENGVECCAFIAAIALPAGTPSTDAAAEAFSRELIELIPTVKKHLVDCDVRVDLSKLSQPSGN